MFEEKLSKLKRINKILIKNKGFYTNNNNKTIEQKIAENSFYYGGVLGFKGLYEVDFNNWWDAFFLGNEAVKLLNMSIKYNPSLYEAYYGLGLYYYWKGAKAKDLWYIPFVNDSREKGIKALKLSIEKSDLVKIESQISLLRVGINEMNQEMIDKYHKGLFEKYPNNIYLHRNFIKYYAKKKEYKKMKIYLDHLNSLKNKYLQYDLTFFSMFLNYYYALFYFNIDNNYNKSKNYLEKNLKNQKKETTNKKSAIILKKYLKMSRKLKKEID